MKRTCKWLALLLAFCFSMSFSVVAFAQESVPNSLASAADEVFPKSNGELPAASLPENNEPSAGELLPENDEDQPTETVPQESTAVVEILTGETADNSSEGGGEPSVEVTPSDNDPAPDSIVLTEVPEDEQIMISEEVISQDSVAVSPSTYYIDAVSGSDTNIGLSDQAPWQTLEKINATTFQPGDKILLKTGCSWTGSLILHGSGSADTPICVDMYGEGEKPQIVGGEADYKVVSLINESNWEINNLRVTSNVTHNNDRRTGIWVENQDKGTLSHIYIRGCEVYNIHSKDTNSDRECLFGGISVTGYGGSSKYDDLRIEHNYVHDLCKGGITTYTYNESRNIWDATFGYSTNVYIGHNTVRNVKGDGIVAKNVDGAVIEYNMCDGAANGGAGSSAQYGCYAGIWGAFCKNSVFRYNEVYNTHRFLPGNNDGMAFDADIKCENVVFEYNYSHDNEGGFFLDMGDTINTVVRYNISQNDKSRLFMFSSSSKLDVKAYNNTFYIGENLATKIQDDDFAAASRGVVYTNNIFYNLGTGAYNQGGAQFISNCFYGSGNKPSGSENIIADPGLVDVGMGGTGIDFTDPGRLPGYRLSANSPCIGTGTAISSNGESDFWGNPLYHAQADIGANESGYDVAENIEVQVNDNDARLAYLGDWTYDTACAGGYSGDSHYTHTAGDAVALAFKGTSVKWLGQKDKNYGKADVYLDGVFQQTVDCYNAENIYQQVLFSAADLPVEEHILRIVCKGEKNGASEDNYIDLDGVVFTLGTTQNAVNNAGFESGAAYPWNAYNGAKVVLGNQNSGNYAAKAGKNSGFEQSVAVEPNTSYVLQGWAKVGSAGSVMTLGVKNYGGNEIFSTATSTQYKRITVTFTTGLSTRNVTIFGYRQNNGSGDGYLDDVTLEKVTDLSVYEPLQNAVAPQSIPTYEGTNQPTHPSVVKFDTAWNGYTYWMAMTPYPFNDGSYENPSIVVSNDGVNWAVPSSVTNPLVGTPSRGHNCDVDLVYVPSADELRMYYVDADDIISSRIKMIRTTDGVHWSSSTTVVTDLIHKYSMLSPSIELLPDGTYMMWYVDAGNAGWQSQSNTVKYRTSSDGINWSSARTCTDFVQPGYQIWHIDVHYDAVSDKYYAVFPAYPNGTNCDYCQLFFAVNNTGKKWEFFDKPILKASNGGGWDDFCIYRSSMLLEGDDIKVWYGAKKQEDSSWHIGMVQRNFGEFLNTLGS